LGVNVGGIGEGVNVDGIGVEVGMGVGAGAHPLIKTIRITNAGRIDRIDFFITLISY
jgi:hypothetical protein